MSSTRSRQPSITTLSLSAVRRLLEQEAATLFGMRRLLPEGAVKPSRAPKEVKAPSCIAVLPMHYCAAGEIAQAKRRTKSAYSSLALVDWGGRAKGSVQFHRTRKGWKLASLNMGPPAKALHRALEHVGASGGAHDVLVVPHLRLTLLVTASPGSTARRLQVIQSGLTSLRVGSRFVPETLQKRLVEEDRAHADAVNRSLLHAEKVARRLGRGVRPKNRQQKHKQESRGIS